MMVEATTCLENGFALWKQYKPPGAAGECSVLHKQVIFDVHGRWVSSPASTSLICTPSRLTIPASTTVVL